MSLERSFRELSSAVYRFEVAFPGPFDDHRSPRYETYSGATPFVSPAPRAVDIDERNVDLANSMGEPVERHAEDPFGCACGGCAHDRGYTTNLNFSHRSLLKKSE
jgi:hypothetical protein